MASSTAEFAPGVRTEERAPVARPANVGLTLTGFLGKAKRGPTTFAQLITRWSEYVKYFGGFTDNVDLGIHVRQFFDNGGAACRVLRVAASDAVAASNTADGYDRGDSVNAEYHAQNPGEWGDELGINFALREVTTTAAQLDVDDDDNDLPSNGANGDSNDSIRLRVSDTTKIAVGDVVDVFDASGTIESHSPLLVHGLLDGSVVTQLPAGMNIDGAGYYVRSCSQHRARTFAMEALADGATSLLLDSVEGITRGSLLTVFIFSHCKTVAARGLLGRCNVIVNRVSGNRVYFTAAAATSTEETLPATTNAALRYSIDGTEYITFVANDTGPSGNRVAIKITTGAGANGITVTGKTINVASATYTCETLATAINAHAAASALVTASAVDSSNHNTALADDLLETRLTGGAKLLVVSQEVGLEVYLAEEVVEQHNYLSFIAESPDFIGTRLGGNPDTYTPVDGTESAFIIVSGMNETTGTADQEYARQPRAVSVFSLSGGDDGAEPADSDWIGTSSPPTGAYLLASYEDLKLACAPGVTSPDVQIEFVERAAESGTFEWLLDPPVDATSGTLLMEHRTNELGLNTRFGQLASTWAYIRDVRSGALRGGLVLAPPTPAWAGLISTAQRTVGSHGSPGNLAPQGWVRLAYNASKADAGLLNEGGVCVFRVVSGALKCYGDRTLLQIDDPRKFGNVSRMLNQFIHDAEAALAGVVFAPGNEDLFPLVESILNRILKGLWEAGALYPRSDAKRAYSVTCNEETTTPEMLAQGKVFVEVALSPSTLAERIVVGLSVGAGGIEIQA